MTVKQIFKGLSGGNFEERVIIRVIHNENDLYIIDIYDCVSVFGFITLTADTARELAEAILKEAGA